MRKKAIAMIVGGLATISILGFNVISAAAEPKQAMQHEKMQCCEKMEGMDHQKMGDMMKNPEMMKKCMDMMMSPEMQSMMKQMMQNDPAFHHAMKELVNSVEPAPTDNQSTAQVTSDDSSAHNHK